MGLACTTLAPAWVSENSVGELQCVMLWNCRKVTKNLRFAGRSGIRERSAKRRTAWGNVAIRNIAFRDSVHIDYRDRDGRRGFEQIYSFHGHSWLLMNDSPCNILLFEAMFELGT